jgi:hypothetical protein
MLLSLYVGTYVSVTYSSGSVRVSAEGILSWVPERQCWQVLFEAGALSWDMTSFHHADLVSGIPHITLR